MDPDAVRALSHLHKAYTEIMKAREAMSNSDLWDDIAGLAENIETIARKLRGE